MANFDYDMNGPAAEYMGNSVYQSVRPWLAMLTMYKNIGRRREFEVIASRLHEDFNLGVIHWNVSEVETDAGCQAGIEAHTHIVERIAAYWGTAACLEYINGLLEDNRAGTRNGFSLAAFEELLTLAEMLEEHLVPRAPMFPVSHRVEVAEVSDFGGVLSRALVAPFTMLNRLFTGQESRSSSRDRVLHS